ncbi:EAL domain-containing protein [Bacillus sp. EB106-08-02-XG196]|uniref:EAL domain-containing protein n=1 Tax=Bacillus sp. EB106-08-02-XG196 TaxID=2737049 RepID=UPI0015C46017|nr:EAL domain-containing protein [Bacillus sp. EB106-08-02-XG196]NWQ41391.1 EAL domain-containing protein [Bacillus sp. EB106-08-02-XG196]
MDFKKESNKELIMDTVNKKIQKIIFDIIFQHLQDMVYVMKVEEGPSFRYLFVNEAGLKKANLPLDIIGKTMIEVLPYEFAINLQKNYLKLSQKKEIICFDDVFYFEDGRKIYGETILTPIFNEEKRISYVVAVTRDVTAWSIEKNKIIESEQRFRSIVDNNLDAIFMISLDGQILEANPAAIKMTGYAEQQMMNKPIYNLINERDMVEFKAQLEKTYTGYALESLNYKLLHSNGQLLIVHLKTVPIVIHGEISGVYVMCKDVSEQAKNMETIKFMAFHDQLTGLLNRRALLEHLNDLINRSETKRREFALLSIDLDRFKFLNDTLGHIAGDEILKRVSERLAQFQNENCFVYRQGGDEFSILLVNINRESTVKFVQKVFAQFVQSFYYNSQEYYISPSIGISMYPNDGKDAEMLIKNADEAMFRVKEKGKAHYQFYRSDMNTVFTNIVTLETNLRKAIDKDELHLVFQPQIDINSGETASFEALLRWNNAEFGWISPSFFIPLAEDTGLIISIGHWVIEKTCKQIQHWNNLGYHDIRVAINISAIQFQQHNLVNVIRSMIKKYSITASSLEIEITEGAMQDTTETIPILKRLKQLGITISVDDFGTGYSSLNYLKCFPIDVLKIDRSFIRDILDDEKAAAITSTIIHLGRSLGLEVIAEGVENSDQVEFLKNANCHKIQGYYYSKPIPAKELEEKFLSRKNLKGNSRSN